MVTSKIIEDLKIKANEIRIEIIKMIYKAQSGHPGGALSATDIVTSLYFYLMNVNTKKPDWINRDRFILSKGHACPVLYAALAARGFYQKSLCDTLRCIDSKLQGHPDMKKLSGLDATTGALGEGLSIGVGMAIVGKMDKKDYYIYVLIGDGESQEGQIWEAAMSAAKYKLDNLIVFTDYNRLQVDGFVKDVMSIDPLKEKWEAFGWQVQEIDGNNIADIISAVENAKTIRNKPHMIICYTIKGKGVSFMENQPDWHAGSPNIEELKKALQDLGGKYNE
ncbi:MAG: transketolase [Atribacterota bacterium]|nr:transketolase [Atribacterota bacterium]